VRLQTQNEKLTLPKNIQTRHAHFSPFSMQWGKGSGDRGSLLTILLFFILTACAPAPTPMPTDAPTLIPTSTYVPTLAPLSDYPTVDAIHAADIPARDRVDLARRFLGITDIPAPPASVPTRQVGEQQMFWVSNSSADVETQITATLLAVGEHIYIWVDSSANVATEAAENLAEIFDTRIYDSVREFWGTEPNPGIDGDPHVYALFAHGLGSGVGGYFASDHLYPEVISPHSNEHEMFMFSLDTMGIDINNSNVQSILGHEFQHSIRTNIDSNEDTWMDEGFSMFTELSLGYPNPLGAAATFLATPNTQLNTWAEDPPRDAHYGASMLFMQYFFERYGRETIYTLGMDSASGMSAVENTIGVEETRTLLADWTLANYFMLPETGYGYYILPEVMAGASPLGTVTSYPFTDNRLSLQYAAGYYPLTNLGRSQTLDVRLAMSEVTPLIGTTPPSGQWMMYSSKADDSDTTLTRAFDLSGVTAATLNYRVWYYLEEYWDYGYVEVSTDNGETWQTLAAPHTITDDPHHNAYGVGYTGQSDGWLDESVSLDSYAGQQILVRFEVITDDSISQPGMLIDDVRIPELDYSESFENGAGDWQAEGWIRTDNRLPQQAWVQVAQQVGDEIHVSRFLFPDEGVSWSVPLETDASQVVLAIFPFAPLTIVPVSYMLNVEVN
jgi:immune inhibitor A